MARSRNHSLIVAAMALLLGLALSSCGTSAPTKQDVIARGNAICENALRAVRAIPPPRSATSQADLGTYLQQVLPVVDKEVAALRALPRPALDEALLNQFDAAVKNSGAEYHALAAAVRSRDQAALAQAGARLRVNPAAALAKRYGLDGCAASTGTVKRPSG
jgi:hypothetical protein